MVADEHARWVACGYTAGGGRLGVGDTLAHWLRRARAAVAERCARRSGQDEQKREEAPQTRADDDKRKKIKMIKQCERGQRKVTLEKPEATRRRVCDDGDVGDGEAGHSGRQCGASLGFGLRQEPLPLRPRSEVKGWLQRRQALAMSQRVIIVAARANTDLVAWRWCLQGRIDGWQA